MMQNGGEGGLKMGELQFRQYHTNDGLIFDTNSDALGYLAAMVDEIARMSAKILKNEDGKFVIWYCATA